MFALFFNNALSSYISLLITGSKFYGTGGFIEEVYSMYLAIVTSQIFFQLLDLNYIRKFIIQHKNFFKNKYIT